MVNPRQGKGRTTMTIQNDIMQAFPYFIKESQEISITSSRIRIRQFSVITIIKLLSALNHYDMSMSELYRMSNIIMKRSYLNYLKMCVNFGFMEKQNRGQYSYYHITEKGKTLLDLFRK